ncbi:MAG: aspartate dehydrogenase [Rhodobacteraceae bacterium]|nr:aspartate dehydrogenase [Paracoccaceae bacterium]
MSLGHLGLIGFGSIGRELLEILKREESLPRRLCVVVRPGREEETAGVLADLVPGVATKVLTSGTDLAAARPHLVVEAAGHGGLRDHALPCLRAGIETIVVSIGALADEALHAEALAAAEAGGARLVLPAGAVGGIDILSALRLSGVTRLVYTSRKPPQAWAGTPAETLLDLAGLTEPAVFFTGNARRAALEYPKNANVAATLALAGPGFEATEVRMMADPGITQNVHEFEVEAGAAAFSIRIEGRPSPGNARTSLTTVYSVAREVLNRSRRVSI